MEPTLYWPLKKPFVITQRFGQNPALYRQFGLKAHSGIDLRPEPQKTTFPVYASHDGVVYYAGGNANEGYGVDIISLNPVLYKDGQYAHYKTKYWHFARDGIKVRAGQRVVVGDLIGMGNNSGFSSAPHLHYAVKFGEVRQGFWIKNYDQENGYFGSVDPEPFLSQMSAYEFRGKLQTLKELIDQLSMLVDLWIKGR